MPYLEITDKPSLPLEKRIDGVIEAAIKLFFPSLTNITPHLNTLVSLIMYLTSSKHTTDRTINMLFAIANDITNLFKVGQNIVQESLVSTIRIH